jgi:D-glycero-D-manno-heptose 1,7-bisphosphate phosphatase
MKSVAAVFLDRDGVINEYPGDFQYVTSWEEFRFLPGSKEAIKKLSESGYRIFVISNQAGVSKGFYSRETLDT